MKMNLKGVICLLIALFLAGISVHNLILLWLSFILDMQASLEDTFLGVTGGEELTLCFPLWPSMRCWKEQLSG